MKAKHYLGMLGEVVELLLALAITPAWNVFVTLIDKLDYVQELKKRRCK